MCQSGIKCHCKQSSGSDVHAHCSQQKWCKEREEYISGGKNTQEQGQLSPTVLDVVAAVIYVASSYGCIMKAAARTEVGHHKIKMFENTWSKTLEYASFWLIVHCIFHIHPQDYIFTRSDRGLSSMVPWANCQLFK